MCLKFPIKPAPTPILPSRTILLLGPPFSGISTFYTHISTSPSHLSLKLHNTSHPLTFFNGTALHAYDSSLARDHLSCFTGAVVLYSPSSPQSLSAARRIVSELRGYELPGLIKGGIAVVSNKIRAGKEGRELGVIEGADAHLECDIGSGEGCEEVVGELVRVIEGRWEERVVGMEKRLAMEEWEAEMKKRGRGWRRMLCGGRQG